MNYDVHGGKLVKTEGKVTRVLVENGALSEFWLMDSTGKEAAIFIDGYIYSGTTGENNLAETVKEGATVSAVGVLYMHPEGSSDVSVPVLRVRNCDEIEVIEVPVTKLEIIKQPQDFFAPSHGVSVEIAVEAQGDGLKYSWFTKPSDGTVKEAGQYTDTFSTVASDSTDNMEVYCVISDAYGNLVTSEPAKIIPGGVVISKWTGYNVYGKAGYKAALKAEGLAYDYVDGEVKLGAEGVTYCWYVKYTVKNGGDGQFHRAGGTGKVFSLPLKTDCDGAELFCRITDKYGNSVDTKITKIHVMK